MFYNQLNIPFFIVPVFGTIKKKIIALVQQAIWCLILTSQETEARPGCGSGTPGCPNRINALSFVKHNTSLEDDD